MDQVVCTEMATEVYTCPRMGVKFNKSVSLAYLYPYEIAKHSLRNSGWIGVAASQQSLVHPQEKFLFSVRNGGKPWGLQRLMASRGHTKTCLGLVEDMDISRRSITEVARCEHQVRHLEARCFIVNQSYTSFPDIIQIYIKTRYHSRKEAQGTIPALTEFIWK